jgi:hypothetical protein
MQEGRSQKQHQGKERHERGFTPAKEVSVRHPSVPEPVSIIPRHQAHFRFIIGAGKGARKKIPAPGRIPSAKDEEIELPGSVFQEPLFRHERPDEGRRLTQEMFPKEVHFDLFLLNQVNPLP